MAGTSPAMTLYKWFHPTGIGFSDDHDPAMPVA
jgi:hypothetical protein